MLEAFKDLLRSNALSRNLAESSPFALKRSEISENGSKNHPGT